MRGWGGEGNWKGREGKDLREGPTGGGVNSTMMGGESEAPSAFAWPAGMGNSLLLKFPLTVEFPKFPSNSPLHFPLV